MMRDPKTNKYGVITVLRDAFSSLTTGDVKQLTEQDRLELASAHSRALGMDPGELSFTPVAY